MDIEKGIIPTSAEFWLSQAKYMPPGDFRDLPVSADFTRVGDSVTIECDIPCTTGSARFKRTLTLAEFTRMF